MLFFGTPDDSDLPATPATFIGLRLGFTCDSGCIIGQWLHQESFVCPVVKEKINDLPIVKIHVTVFVFQSTVNKGHATLPFTNLNCKVSGGG